MRNKLRHLLQRARVFAGLRAAAVACLLGLSQTVAYADVWAYVDETGAMHFSPTQVDERYAIFYRAPGATKDVASTAVAEPAPVVPSTPVLPSRLIGFFETSPRFLQVKPLLKETAKTYRIDIELLQALIATESAFNASAVSVKGAVGLMQVMPDTGKRFGMEDDRWGPVERKLVDPKINLRIGGRYLRLLLDMFPGNLDLALASYNAGEGAVQKAGNKIPNYPETQAYVAMVTQIYNALKPPPAPAPVPAEPVKTAERIRAEKYGSGFVLTLPTDAYRLKRPNVAPTDESAAAVPLVAVE